jgi:hypothetical protein
MNDQKPSKINQPAILPSSASLQSAFLEPAYPNPAVQTTTLSYRLANASSVMLYLSDMMGRRIATIVDGAQQEAGEHSIEFNVADLSPGLYIYTLQTPTYKESKRLVVVK